MNTRSSIPSSGDPTTRCGALRKSKTSGWRAASLIAVHLAILAHIAHWKVSGTTLSPLEPSEAMQTLELGYVNAGFVLFVVLIAITLIVGRFFCGWACHVVAYQDLSAWALAKIGVRPRPVRSRLLVFVPIGAALYMFVWPQVTRLIDNDDLPKLVWHLTTDSFWATFPTPAIAALTFLVDGFLIVYLLGSKGFCTYGCPYGAVFGAVDRVAPVRIRVNDQCEQCGHCTATCTSNVRVHQEVARFGMVVDPGCMKCLDCVSVCPKDALFLGAGPPALRSATRRKRAYDFSWREEAALAAIFLLALYAVRGLYGVVPFLLALGIAVITAAVAILAWRLLTTREFTVQHYALRRRDGLTRLGVAALASTAALLLFIGHSGYVQYHLREGERLTAQARSLPADLRRDEVADARRHLRTVERFALVEEERVLNLLAGVHRLDGDFAGAASYLRRSLDHSKTAGKYLELSTLFMHLQRVADARQALLDTLALEPDNDEAKRRLTLLDERR